MKLKGHGRKPKTKKVVPAGGEASTSSSNVIPLETTHEPSKISEAAPPPIALKPAATSSSATPTVIPNIAAAGRLLAPPKWAETKPTSSTIKQEPIGFSPNRHLQSANNLNGKEHQSSRGRGGGGRGVYKPRGRGRGRGRGSGFQSSTIIQTEGAFSLGIGTGEGGPRVRGVRNNRVVKGEEETVVGQLESSLHDNDDFIDDSDVKQKKKGKQKEETEKKLKVDGTQPSNAYEEFWQSDDDLDREELGDIVRGNFIADLKQCEHMPFVLPAYEEPQFCKVISRGKKGQLNEGKEEADVKDIKLRKELLLARKTEAESQELSNRNPIDKLMAAGNSIRSIAKESEQASIENPPLMVFQLPSTLVRIAQQQTANRQQQTKEPEGMEIAEQSAMQSRIQQQKQLLQNPNWPSNVIEKSTADSGRGAQPQQQQNCLTSLSAMGGTQLGKLQFLRSGRAVLRIGGHRVDLAEAIPSNCFETLLKVETAAPTATGSCGFTVAPGMLDGGSGGGVAEQAESATTSQSQQSIRSNSSLLHQNGGIEQHPLMTTHSYSSNRLADLSSSLPGCSTSVKLARHSQANVAHLLGPLPHQFVCSFDMRRQILQLSETNKVKSGNHRQRDGSTIADNEAAKSATELNMEPAKANRGDDKP